MSPNLDVGKPSRRQKFGWQFLPRLEAFIEPLHAQRCTWLAIDNGQTPRLQGVEDVGGSASSQSGVMLGINGMYGKVQCECVCVLE
jgi:hypothetical protein